jgi:hypothetical protein
MKKTSDEKMKLEFRPLKFHRGGKPVEDKTTPEQRKRHLAWGWFHIGLLHPEYDDAEWSGVLDGAGSLQSLLLPLIALQELGDAETLRRKRGEIQEVAEKLRGLVDSFSSLNPTESIFEKEWKAQFDRLGANLQRHIDRMTKAEEILKKAGWNFDSKTRKAKRDRDGKGKDLLTECVWAIYTESYREEYGGASAAKKLSIRRKIAAVLAPYFDATELSPESGAPIYMAIYKGENPPK